ncbi:MAG TPA: hypothetical protein VGD23_02205 [Sphingomicrobium sp.]
MFKFKTKWRSSRAIPALALAAATVLASSADARDRLAGVRGVRGDGIIAGRRVTHEPGSIQVRQGFLTVGERGLYEERSTNWGEGSINRSIDRTYANGSTMSRDRSITRNPDGSVSTSRSHTGVAGNSQSGWSTIYRTDDGYRRTRSASTSNGRGYEATRDVSVGEDMVTIDRSLTTKSGRSVTRSRTRPRRR